MRIPHGQGLGSATLVRLEYMNVASVADALDSPVSAASLFTRCGWDYLF